MTLLDELAKLAAFIRRDLRIAASYRMALVVGVLFLAAQALTFSFIGKLVDPARLPTYGGTESTYLEFASIGIVFNMVVILMLNQVSTAMRNEQLIGTLESLLITPTWIGTIQMGSAAFELLWVPLRFSLFLLAIALLFGLNLHASGIAPAIVLLLVFLPFLWGVGLASAGAMLTYRRGGSAMAVSGTILSLASGAFFPLALLPAWLAVIAKLNPLAIALDGLRNALIGGPDWSPILTDLEKLAPLSVVALGVGMLAFRLALRRERRLGTLGMY